MLVQGLALVTTMNEGGFTLDPRRADPQSVTALPKWPYVDRHWESTGETEQATRLRYVNS